MKRIDISMIIDYDDRDEERLMDKLMKGITANPSYSKLVDYSLSVTKEYALLRTVPAAEGALALVVRPIKRLANDMQNSNGDSGHDTEY